MMKKNLMQAALLILIIITVGIAGCVAANNQTIGGDKDEHGCLIAAGYSWCEAKQKCLRIWEENCTGGGAQLANPASVFCVEGGGTHKVIDTPEGQVGYCEFPDGNVCEEWEFFRSNSTTCNPPPA